MDSFIVVLAGLGWSLFLIQRYRNSDALRFPELFAPVTAEERKVREELTDAASLIGDLRIRLKYAEHERDLAALRARRAHEECAEQRAMLWGIRRILDRAPEPMPLADAETVELVGCEERAG